MMSSFGVVLAQATAGNSRQHQGMHPMSNMAVGFVCIHSSPRRGESQGRTFGLITAIVTAEILDRPEELVNTIDEPYLVKSSR